MALRAGDLRHRVTIQRPRGNDLRDSTGQPVSDWPDVAEVWASIEPLSARESFAAQQAQSTVSHRIRMRYRVDVDGSCRVRYIDPGTKRTRFFYFDGAPISPDEKREELTGMAQERGK